MTKHKHAELIKAKADNMELVVFFKADEVEWRKTDSQNVFPTVNSPHVKYFLCHPKHADVCLHWLNGGEYQFKDDSISEWDTVGQRRAWSKNSPFMSDDFDFRIKPRKEKRWIAVNNKDDVARGKAYTSKELAKESVMFPDDWQLIEI